jgi:hypothetical protein
MHQSVAMLRPRTMRAFLHPRSKKNYVKKPKMLDKIRRLFRQ